MRTEGMRNIDIVRKLGCSKSTVTYALMDTIHYKKLIKYDRKLVLQLKNEGMRNIDISRKLGCKKSTITEILKSVKNSSLAKLDSN